MAGEERIAAARLSAIVARILEAGGCADDIAAEVADNLVDAETSGHGSHGVRQIELYMKRLARGVVDGRARPSIAEESGAVVRIDGNRSFGQIAGEFGARAGIRAALANGVCGVAIVSCGHFGRNGRWAELAAAAGVASIHFGQGIGKPGPVAPYGGREGRLNTNPIAIGFPGGGDGDIILDCATSEVSGSKIKQIYEKGELLATECLVTERGAPSQDPADFVTGRAAVIPFGGFKGYAISVFGELFSTLLGAAARPLPETNSMFSFYVDVSRFVENDAFRRAVSEYRTLIETTPPMPGVEKVMLPGDRSRTNREGAGGEIVLSRSTVEILRNAATAAGVGEALSPELSV